MPFPESPRVVYRNNPLVEVVCQLRFPPILQIGSEDPAEFQNSIRDLYPDYERDVHESEELSELLNQIGASPNSGNVTHKFKTEDGQGMISLAREFVAHTEFDYERWTDFREEVVRMKEAVEKIYGPNFYKRIGLRYRDVIDRQALGLEDVPWDQLLNGTLLGLLGEDELQGRVEETISRVKIQLDEPEGCYAVLRHGFALESNNEHQVYLVDADFYCDSRTQGEAVLGILDTFNGGAGNLFRWAISERLERALDPQEGG